MTLPRGGGTVTHDAAFLPPPDANAILAALTALPAGTYRRRKIRLFANPVEQPRSVTCWGAPGTVYTYSRSPVAADAWLAAVGQHLREAMGAAAGVPAEHFYVELANH